MSLYDELGVPKDADSGTIKRAYRRKAQKLHPDKAGGDKDKFHAVQKAYDVLCDDSRRARYDATGEDGQIDKQGELTSRLARLFLSMIESQDVDHADIMRLMKESLGIARGKTQDEIRAVDQRIAKYERTKKRVGKKGEAGDNLFVQMLDGQISILRRGIELGKAEIENVNAMLKMLDDYFYTADAKMGNQATMMSLMQMAAGAEGMACRGR